MFFQETAKVNENSSKEIKKVKFAKKKAKQLQKTASVEVQPVKKVPIRNKKSKKESEHVVEGINMADQIKKNEELASESSEQKVHS